MCLNPIKLTNPSKTISMSGGQLFQMEVPCGKCAECLERRKNDWYFRSYYEAKSTFDNGGYVYFDTLTYDSEHLPHINDFLKEEYQFPESENVSCFNLEHYRLFFVRLRRYLTYHGFDVAHNLKYFLTSEYGDDDRYTHRPHYHVLFFVTDPSLNPLDLSRAVNACWQMGRTDGIDWHPYAYVKEHIYGYKYNCDRVHMQMVCNYVSKYVAKDSAFSSTIQGKLDHIFTQLYGPMDVWSEDDEIKRSYDFLRRQMLQFNRQSKGFGEDFLRYNDESEVLKTGMIAMPDKKDIVRHTPMPTYYVRKLLYNLRRDAYGALHWELNEKGIDYKFRRAQQTVDIIATKIGDWLSNMMAFNYYHDPNDTDWYRTHYERFMELNGERPLKQFAEYLVYYKGRVKSPSQVERERRGEFRVDDPKEFFLSGLRQDTASGAVYNYGSKIDKEVFGEKFITDTWLGDVNEWRKDGLPEDLWRWRMTRKLYENYFGFTPSMVDRFAPNNLRDSIGNYRSQSKFRWRYVISDKADERFQFYDWMWSLYCDAQLEKNEAKEKAYQEKLELKKRMKAAGLYVKNI